MKKSKIKGWYYLHQNNSLIYKNDPMAIIGIRESDLCLSAWPFDGSRENGWTILVESCALGVDIDRVNELAKKWECDDLDADNYAKLIGVELGIDGTMQTAVTKNFVNLQVSPVGFGKTKLEAMAELCKELGYKGRKMWEPTFNDLLKSCTGTK
jgi:hypothetical protein